MTTPADHAANGLCILWPDDALQDDETVHLPGGTSFIEGSHLSGDGMATTLDDLPDGADRESKIGNFGRFCGADTSDVIVLRRVTGVRPEAATTTSRSSRRPRARRSPGGC